MIGYILDTDTLSLVRGGHPRVIARVRAHHTAGDLAITVVSVEEQLTGWYSVLRRANRRDRLALAYQRLAESVQFLARFPILPFPEPAIARFEGLKALRLNVGSMDLRIAATVLEAGATLVTRNLRDFQRVPGLVIEDRST
jgi:tRNA(fMet)-specific endonuclease VapC